jgi:CRISPR-associated endonuclease/helicase Cas3
MLTIEHIAHYRPEDKSSQSLFDHLTAVAKLSSSFAAKVQLEAAGELIGLCHDFGKFSGVFQSYIKSAVGILDQDVDADFVNASDLKGKIDHSTAGAQAIWRSMNSDKMGRIVGQILALCVASHHSGLIDCINGSGERFGSDRFLERMNRSESWSHLNEVLAAIPHQLNDRFQSLVSDQTLLESVKRKIAQIVRACGSKNEAQIQVHTGLLARLLFSCLLDADRTDTACFAEPYQRHIKNRQRAADWQNLVFRLETFLTHIPNVYAIDETRTRISAECLLRATSKQDVFSLSVPTGGGKTLASLRFALHHARHHQLDRIFFIIPYTSIIDQNADQVRSILESPSDDALTVLEHHSNITPEKQTWREKILAESWDAPVVFTTMVQFLETLFAGGTRGARRMHQLCRSVIVFDEIQCLPVNCVHLFNNAINFITEQCGSSAVLCTATQPLLHTVDQSKGAARLKRENEIISDVHSLFDELCRVEVKDQTQPNGWTSQEVAQLVVDEASRTTSCLAIVNTKRAARSLFEAVKAVCEVPIFHLSTSMCPHHRKRLLRIIRARLKSKKPTICISTQLIEAGVDVDFGTVVRHLAGLDSIAQAAGRCNRNGEQTKGTVHIVNSSDESLKHLTDIRLGAEITKRILQDFREDPDRFKNSLLSPQAIGWYYEQYFHRRSDVMAYPVPAARIGHDDTVLNLLSQNLFAVSEYTNREEQNQRPRAAPTTYLRQAFMTAAEAFRVIDAPTRGIIVPFARAGRKLESDLFAAKTPAELFAQLRHAQQFTVNVFDHTLAALNAQGAVRKVSADVEILIVDGRFYHNEFGLTEEPITSMEFLNG